VRLFERARPAARAMKDRENFNIIAAHAIRYNVGRTDHDEFTRAGQPARSAEIRMVAQFVDGSNEAEDDSLGGYGIVARDKVSNRLEIRER
jgi:hypothetical protein